MVEIVEPHRVVPPLLERPQVLVVHLRDDEPVDTVSQLFQDVRIGAVDDGVHCVDAQTVDAVLARPQLRVLDRPFADAALRVVERRPPDRLDALGEVRAERGDRLGAGAEVVVDDVQDHAEAFAVRGVDEPREPVRTAVRRMRRERVDAVVAPVAVAREGRDGHQLDRGDAELAQLASRGTTPSNVPSRENVPTCSSYRTSSSSVSRGPGAISKPVVSSTRDEPSNPPGCQREQGSARLEPPSTTNV